MVITIISVFIFMTLFIDNVVTVIAVINISSVFYYFVIISSVPFIIIFIINIVAVFIVIQRSQDSVFRLDNLMLSHHWTILPVEKVLRLFYACIIDLLDHLEAHLFN